MWVLLTLITAFFTSLQDVFSRKAIERTDYRVVAWAWAACSLPFLLPFVIAEKTVIQPAFWPAVAISGIIISVSFLFYFKAIYISDLSLCVPMLAFTPAFMLITSPIILKEFPSTLGLVGILLIVAGSYVLNFNLKQQGLFEPFRYLVKNKGTRLVLYVAVLYSINANIDKIGVANSSPVMWVFGLSATIALILTPVVLIRVKDPVASFMRNCKILLLIGLFTVLGVVVQMYAIRLTLVPYVIAIKRTSVVMTALFGFFVFKERGLRERLIGVVLMVLGVFVISFFAHS